MKVLSEAPLNGAEHDQRVNGAEQPLYGFPYIFIERQGEKIRMHQIMSDEFKPVLVLSFAISRRFGSYIC